MQTTAKQYRVSFRLPDSQGKGKLFAQYLVTAPDHGVAAGRGWKKLWTSHPEMNRRTLREVVEVVA